MLTSLIIEIIPGIMALFAHVIIPVGGKLLTFTLPRLVKIPIYLRLLWTIYTDSETTGEARKYLTSVLVVLSSILTFVTYSYIPLTGVPIIGAFTTPIAGMLAMVVCLVSLEVIFNLNQEYLQNKYPQEFSSVSSDIAEISQVLGKSWEEMVKQTQSLLDAVKQKIDPNGKYDDTLLASLSALDRYLWEPQSNTSLSPDEINYRIVTDALPPLAKIGGSVAEGALIGTVIATTAHNAAAGVFVQAGFLTGIKAALGLAGGVMVGAPVYAALTIAAPIGLAVLGGAGVFTGASFLRGAEEKRKLSTFMADILIAALPMAWIDGNLSQEEKDTLEQFILNPALNEKDSKRIREAMQQHITFDQILHQGLLKEENPIKARMKYRLLLCTTYELAKADGVITNEELALHSRMAKLMKVDEAEIHEIRRLILLKSGLNIRDRISVVQGNIVEQAVDAIVNSANSNLLPRKKLGWLPLPKDNSKIDTVIHQGAGSSLQTECQNLQGCNVGEAKITQGYNLPAPKIIHTVTPLWKEDDNNAKELLGQCYYESLRLAHQNSLRTIAFPALGTGTGNFPLAEAAQVAIRAIEQFLNTHFSVDQIKLVCLDEVSYQVYLNAVDEIMSPKYLLTD